MDRRAILMALKQLVAGDQLLTSIFSKYFSKENCSREECQAIINRLSELLWNENYTIKTAELFSPLLLEFLTRASQFPDDNSSNSYARHEWLCICLSKLIWNYPTVARFTKVYFDKNRNLFWRYEGDEQPPTKKSKTEAVSPYPYQLLKAAYLFLIYDTCFFKELWSWAVIVPFLRNQDVKARWYAHQCLGRVGNIKDSDLSYILEDNFTHDELAICVKEGLELSSLWNHKLYKPLPAELFKDFELGSTCEFITQTVDIQGILLSKMQNAEVPTASRMVCVTSVAESLYSLALAISSSEPVLLKGPVGVGKTSLVEYLGEATGRIPSENFFKVQLGDHIDSKMLLGTHCCTEVPGQFVWKAGVLINAMVEGHWLLLEDIDCAPMDVISLLVPVLQSRSIVLPGHANPVKAAPGFQLFATQRLLRGMDGSYIEFKNNAELIDKQWRKIAINPLSEAELKQVIMTKWPVLEPIIPRILAVYSLFSSDLHNSGTSSQMSLAQEPIFDDLRHGRLISMRDLFKFCGRIAIGFDFTKEQVGVNVFKNAVECFCDNIPNFETRLLAVENIAVKFNLPKTKAKWYLETYKPEIENSDPVVVGRAVLERKPKAISFTRLETSVFAHSRQAVALLEKVSVSVVNKEPVLLVGETGTGKTSVVQYLSEMLNKKLTVINMSQQSDSVDLLGGYKPVDFSFAIQPLKDEFNVLFPLTMDAQKNAKFLAHISHCFYNRRFQELFKLILHVQKNITKLLLSKHSSSEKHLEQVGKWNRLAEKTQNIQKQMEQSKTAVAFKFIEGALIKAMRNGEWLLLDEINLAEAETLECLAGVLEKDDNALLLLEKGDNEPVKRHPDFHVFACMNPATDVGKKDLPAGIRSRFTEFFVEEITSKSDLSVLVREYLKNLAVTQSVIDKVVSFYSNIKTCAATKLNDGTGHRPHYSLRTLCRALKYASTNPCHNVPRSLYEGFCLSFLSQLDNASHSTVTEAIIKGLIEEKQKPILGQLIPEPGNGKYVRIAKYWILGGGLKCETPPNYIFTSTVQRNIQDLARIVSAGRYPVLLQGETSSGKTSLIEYLAKATGNKCVRVNNHEHTDIQEYVGTYSSDDNGQLIFKEGVLVEAMRKGYWIILDELNLAPTEVMEALNRVLDDNRELFIAETQTLVKAHQGFMIFATQNPPGQYGGRKILSRAFRNRFIELHFNEIPPSELETILSKRCFLAPSHSKKLVGVMQELQMRRRESGVFAGKQGFITLRDLFRWGERFKGFRQPDEFYDWDQHLAEEGYLLLAGRVRHSEEARVIQEVLKKHFKRDVDPNRLFDLNQNTSLVTRRILQRCYETDFRMTDLCNVVWTRHLRRLAVLVGKAMYFKEPCLLVGNTGCGKTTMCQMYGLVFEKELYTVNCHMHTEAADFLGGLRPVRNAEKRETQLFEWKDGPLVQAMTEGNFFLADEISLADHSVLERLNSVLEPERKLFLTEKSYDNYKDSEIKAKEHFYFFATMNPGGDYGKKELSPALRNRFTEIWCPSDVSVESVTDIVAHNLHIANLRSSYGRNIADFMNFYSNNPSTRWSSITLRDVLTWVDFINIMFNEGEPPFMKPHEAYLHGAFLVFLDSLGSGQTGFEDRQELLEMKATFFQYLASQVGGLRDMDAIPLLTPEMNPKFNDFNIYQNPKYFGIGPFRINTGPYPTQDPHDYELRSHSTKANTMRILRAMQLNKPILLEGSPGVGKTSLIDAIAKASGHKLVRINLSEQTDVSDLFGADLPVEGAETAEFAWRDGSLLQALRANHWILLDELNLASQSVLEGLNACLDHRSEIFISELGETITLDKWQTRIFACQNPYTQGGSRKGLPKSFLNRFTQVFIKPMEHNDLQFITKHIFSKLPEQLVARMLQFNREIDVQINYRRLFGRQGAPFEFNLRDVFRWCKAILSNQTDETDFNIGEYVKLIYGDRMRTEEDKLRVYNIYKATSLAFDPQPILNRPLELHVYEDSIQLGHSSIERIGRNIADTSMMAIATKQLPVLESVMKCIELNWMPILVGPAGSGKSSLVRLLAELSGHHLHVMSVNSEMDTVELLGGFEQVDLNRKVGFIANELEPIVQGAILRCISPLSMDKERGHLADILGHMYSLTNVKRNTSIKSKVRCLVDLINVLEELKIAEAKPVLSRCSNIVKGLCEKITGDALTGGQFEWVDSILIHAVSQGHWLLIDDANFCSPSVLDRLNPLLEPNGVLVVSEQGVIGKDLRTITPHPDFRIFLTMNPKNGEISRPMRNRGVEIFIEPIASETVEWKRELDVAAFAQCKGLVHSSAISKLFKVHNQIVQNTLSESPPLSDFLTATSLYVQLLQNHKEPKLAFLKVCQTIYGRYGQSQIFDKDLPEVSMDFSLPLTSLLPTSLDYRHNSIFASLKKQTAVFTYFLNHLKNFIKMDAKKSTEQEIFFPYPTPNLPSFSSVKDRFFCIMRIMMETSSIDSHKLLNIWLQYTLEYEIKHETPQGLKDILQLCLELKNVLSDQLQDPIVLELLSIVEGVYGHVDIPDVMKSELAVDPRWAPNVYRQILFNLKTCLEEESNESDQMADQLVSYKIEKLGNKFSLLLLWKTQEFVLKPSINKPSLYSLVEADKVFNLLEKKRSHFGAVSKLIPQFLDRVAKSLLELLRMEKWDCPNTCYWKFRDAMFAYFACRKICVEKVKDSMIEYQLIAFSVHYYWLSEKIKMLYHSNDVQLAFKNPDNGECQEGVLYIPESIINNFKHMADSLSQREVKNILRLKVIKKLEHPQGFNNAEAADTYKNATELYKIINLSTHLNSSDVNNLKVVMSNCKDWMPCLMKAIELSVYESMEGAHILEHGLSQLKEIRDNLQIHGFIKANVDNMEVCHKSLPSTNMSNKKMVSDIQLLPFMDYFFVLYSSDLLYQSPLPSTHDALIKIGCEYLCVDPKHLGNILRCLKAKISSSTRMDMQVLLTVTTLSHMRQGFSSEGLRFLQYRLSENDTSTATPDLEWNNSCVWSKQPPLLSYICTTLFDKPSEVPLMCRSPLSSYAEKCVQLESVKTALWNNLEKLTDPRSSIRLTSAAIIKSWFIKLICAVAKTKNVGFNSDTFHKLEVENLFHKSEIYPLCVTDGKSNVLHLVFHSVASLETETAKGFDNPNIMFETSKSFVTIGLLTTMLLLPRDIVDPAVKRNLKAEDYDHKLQEILIEKALRDWIYQVTNGQTFEELAALSSTPYLKGLLQLHQEINKKILGLQKKLIARQKADKFERLKETLHSYMATSGSPDAILEIMQDIIKIIRSSSVESGKAYDCLQKAGNLVKNQKSLVDIINKKFHFYGDLTMPFVAGIEQIMYGMGLARQCIVLKQMDQQVKLKGYKNIADFLSQMVMFPYKSDKTPLSIALSLLNGDNMNCFKSLLTLANVSPLIIGRLVYKLLKSAILEIINEVKVTPQLKESTTQVILKSLTSAFCFLWNLWNTQQMEIKKKKELEDSLYIHRVKHHETEISEEEAIDRKLKATFPSFNSEFADCIASEPDPLGEKLNTPLESVQENLQLTPDDVFEIWQLHATAMAALSPPELMNCDENMKWVLNSNTELDLVTPYLLRYEVVCEIIKAIPDRLDGILDSKLVAGHLIMCNELQERTKISDEMYDIYHDPNPVKVTELFPVLNKLEAHLKELLIEFPEHAQLVQILKLVQRVLSFPVTDPLMKFVIGMELVLESTQLWEQMAHSKISLKFETNELTQKIIECRALELNGWKSGLESVLRKQYKNSAKWWFHIFNLFFSLIQNPENKTDYNSALNGLKQFLEDSPISEFPARLSILHTFLQQSKLSESMRSYKKLAQMFFNLYCYYEQFLPDIQNRIAQIRKPIEKEVKDYVTIARWNDINFYAVKQSVQKSHRFVVKHVKQFEDSLQIPAKHVFALPSKKNLEDNDPLEWTLDIQKNHFLSKDQLSKEAFSDREGTWFGKVPRYNIRIRNFSRKFSKSLPVVNHINTLNEFAGTIMESLQGVISDSGKKICTRSQEKKQGLLLIQKKKQMLSTLFKNLRVIGLSYRQGMIYAKNKNENDILIVSAFEPKHLQTLKFDREYRELILKVSQDTSHYFYKSIAQYALLQKNIETPSKDLSLEIIHRIQGYSGNLLSHVISQRETLVKTSKTIDKMGAFLHTLSALGEESHNTVVVLPPQDDVSQHEILLNNLMVQYMTLINQFGAIMKCSPTSVAVDSVFVNLPSQARVFFLPPKSTTLWADITNGITTCTKVLKQSFHVIFSSSQNPAMLITWSRFSRIVEDFKKLTALITNTMQTFQPLGRKGLESHILRDLCELSDRIVRECSSAMLKRDSLGENIGGPAEEQQNDGLVGTIQHLTKEVLLVFQDLIKASVVDVEEEASVDVYPDNLFTVKISEYMAKFESQFRFEKVLKLMLKLKKIMQHSCRTASDLKAVDGSIRLLANLTPFLNQYFQLVKVYFAANVGMHRTSCKFFSILLEVFNILATKGFCIPAELKEEAEKSGATKFEDIEGGGLGEGEGAKDVSDKIESEDQLEDTFKEGQEKEEDKEEKSDIKNEEQGIEMSEDFEGKSYNPEGEEEQESEKEDNNEEDPDLDKQMGDVDAEDAEKLDEKVWGSDSEEEETEDLNEDEDATGGVTQDQSSEMVAKDGQEKEMDDKKNKDKGNKPDETMQDTQEDDYQGETPDPMIDAPQNEPEVVELPDDMEINDEDKGEKSDNDDTLEINYDPDEALESDVEESDEGGKDEAMEAEDEDSESNPNKAEEEAEDVNNATSADLASEDESAGEEEGNDSKLPTHTPTDEPEALPAGDQSKSSSKDPVQDEAGMDWENGALPPEDQHREGQADARDAYDQGMGHEGKTSSVRQKSSEEDQKHKPKLKAPSENRTLDDSKDNADVKHRPIADKQSQQKSHGSEDTKEGEADVYEHIEKPEDGSKQAVDIATEEQAKIRPVQSQQDHGGADDDDDSDVILLSSDDEEDQVPVANHARTQGDAYKKDPRQRPGERGENQEEEIMEVDRGEVVRTHTASRGETTIHTQHDLWSSMSNRRFQELRYQVEHDLFRHYDAPATSSAIKLWGEYEILVSNLSQELCEQLRLVLEPTKMAKLKGDYRTGKRLNMRKIIPYIASQFRKDKIWLRRTKPSKRQYQIMLAVDDSSSMSDNHSKQLAFESLAVLGQSLSLLEAGELSVVSFGESVELLLGFNEQFSTSTGARVFQKFSFAQRKTGYLGLLRFAKEAMVQARNAGMQKDTAQLLVILSDGRGINNEGEKAVQEAVRQARDCNIFMVFVIIDSPLNKDSILDISCPIFEGNKVSMRSYIESFPFPFYIILRDISTLPVVLGEALRQWFELVTSTER